MSQDPTVPESAPAATLQQLALRLQDFAQQRDWGQFHSPKNLASALIVEAANCWSTFSG